MEIGAIAIKVVLNFSLMGMCITKLMFCLQTDETIKAYDSITCTPEVI